MIIGTSNQIIFKILVQYKTLPEIIAIDIIIPWRFNIDIIFQLRKHK